MICLIALVVFGILGIFSATHRRIALEAFECVFKRIRLRPCDSGLDKRLKSQMIGKLMRRNPKLARFSYRHFETISWAFTILMIVSIIYFGLGIYNFAMYGNCNGKNSQETCIYNRLSGVFKADNCESPSCENNECRCNNELNCQEKESKTCKESCYEEGG
jgi:hypothetical protein